ncbi:MAG: amidohydrolase family protein [Planctomycetes bacterium]|jgi:predicted TIM-barrel fold metal-dependent hydrolase|nr:amidohydrolase family protein [Planctomycetota bacterium]
MMMTRRSFLKKMSHSTVGAGLLSAARLTCLGSAGSPGAAGDLPIVDTHQHLWDLSRLKLTWLKPPLDRSFTLQDYVQASAGLNIVQAVYMEVAAPQGQRMQETEYVLGLCRQPNALTRAAVIAGSPVDEDFVPYVMQFKDNPYIKGLRGALPAQRMGDEQVLKNLRLLGELGLRFDLNVPPAALAQAAQVVARCPGTRFVLNHCGNADPVAFFPAGHVMPRPAQHAAEQWRQDIGKLAAQGNVICKISGIVSRVPGTPLTAEDLAPIIHHCLDAFGPERVVFAGDWPVCLRGMSLRGWVELLKEVVAGQPETDRRRLFQDNAVRFYGLDPRAAQSPQ